MLLWFHKKNISYFCWEQIGKQYDRCYFGLKKYVKAMGWMLPKKDGKAIGWMLQKRWEISVMDATFGFKRKAFKSYFVTRICIHKRIKLLYLPLRI